MRALIAFTVCATCAAAENPQALNRLTAQEKAAGWILLFDGKTMNGWDDPSRKNPPGTAWAIEDDALKAVAKPRITEDLFTKDTFRDFELTWDWKISPAGNSGLKYRIQDHIYVAPADPAIPKERFEARVERSFATRLARPDHGQDYVIGFEYQMTDDAANKDATSSNKHAAGALYDMIAPSSAAALPVGEYNHSRIVLRGNHVEHWMNGKKVVDGSLNAPEALAGMEKRWGVAPHVFELLAKQPTKDCPISLQNHGNDAWFRNIKIRRL